MNSLPLEGVVNARELGGLPVGNKTVRSGLLLRTAHLHDASERDLALLKERYHLRRIFDLRSFPEASMQPDRTIPGSEHILLPTLDTEAEKKSGEIVPEETWLNLPKHIVDLAFKPFFKQNAKMLYPSLVMSEYSQLQYGSFMRLLVETTEGAVLWHCSQGKDRTGVGAAFILGALGASRETIIEEFDLSNIAYRELVASLLEKVYSKGGGEDEADVIRAFMGVSTRNFTRALEMIDAQWGSLENYLRSRLGLSTRDFDILRERYLTF